MLWGRGRETKNAGGHQKLEKSRKSFSPAPLEEPSPADTLTLAQGH